MPYERRRPGVPRQPCPARYRSLRLWIARICGAPMPLEVFVLVNVAGLSLFTAGALVVARQQAHGRIAITMATTS